jgi:osmoprotectant transport system ATP-binding protein
VNTSDSAHPTGPSAPPDRDREADPQSTGNGSGSAREGHAAAVLAFQEVTKVYPGRRTPAVSNLTLEVPAGEICVLIGPSGSGKTTAMQMVNRLISMTSGDVTIDGGSINDLDETELRRGIGYVFQQIGLFPHMTAEDNIGTVPRLLGWSKERIRARAKELLELVGLDPDDDLRRYPGEFSGGQRQRIGVARAMAADQPLMLMDEPFGAVDPIARDRLQDDFLRLHEEVPKTVVFVTHDIDEAIKMGHRIAILRDGELVQYDTPDRILAEPANEFVADFVGADRGLKRLRVWRLGDLELEPTRGEEPAGLTAPEDTSLRDALSVMLVEGKERLTVLDEEGRPKGAVALEAITRLIGPDERAGALKS